MTAKMPCEPDELRTLFLFEALTDEQLETLCTNGHIQQYQPGPICVEGEPATCFYVLIEGELAMSKLSGGQDIETNRTSQRGVYCGAWSAFTAEQHQTYTTSVHVTKPSRFFVMDAPAFGQFMKDQFPMAVHLLDGLAVGTERTRRITASTADGISRRRSSKAASTPIGWSGFARLSTSSRRHQWRGLSAGSTTPSRSSCC